MDREGHPGAAKPKKDDAGGARRLVQRDQIHALAMRALICGSGSDIAVELRTRLEADGWEVWSAAGRSMRVLHGRWDLLLLAHGQLTPIDRFFECDAQEWLSGVMVNAVYPLSCLRSAWPLRNPGA